MRSDDREVLAILWSFWPQPVHWRDIQAFWGTSPRRKGERRVLAALQHIGSYADGWVAAEPPPAGWTGSAAIEWLLSRP